MTQFPKIEFLSDSKEGGYTEPDTVFTDSNFKHKMTQVNYLAIHFGFSLAEVLSVYLIPLVYLVVIIY